MTPRTKKLAINVGAIISALLAGTAWAAKNGAAFVDARYVHQVPYEKARILDSLNYRQDVRDIRAVVFRWDTVMRQQQQRGR